MAEKRIMYFLKSFIPKKIITFLSEVCLKNSLIIKQIYDVFNYLKFSRTFSYNGLNRLEYELITNYHVIEKGLSFQKIKKNFGKERIKIILKLLDKFLAKKYDTTNIFYNATVSTLREYIKWHKTHSFDVKWLESKIKNYPLKFNNYGGVIEIDKDQYIKMAKGNFKELVYSRKSIRNYSSKNISLSSIKKSLKLAQMSPSACNRQPAKVYIIGNKSKIVNVLKLHKGNRGFGNLANKLLIITSDLSTYKGSSEFYGPMIDGSLFAMSLIYSLHYQGLGVCPLNWFASIKRDRALHKLLNIPFNEKVIILILVGNLPDSFKAAKSNRRKTKEIFRIIN